MKRDLFKSAYILRAERVEDHHLEILKELQNEDRRREVEEEIRRRVGGKEGDVLIDMPMGEAAVSEPRLRRADIKVLDEKPIPLSRISSFARALQYRYTPSWYLMVACDRSIREDVAKIAEGIIFG